MSDLHSCEINPSNKILIQTAQALVPDLIILNGDMINENTQSFNEIQEIVSELTKTSEVYYSLGNKEIENAEWPKLKKLLTESGAIVLDKEFRDIKVNGQPIRIGGLYDYSFALNSTNTVEPDLMNPETVNFLQLFQRTNDLKILLSHRPDSFLFNNSIDYWNIDLVLSGHYHGGQVILPFFGGLWAPDVGWFPEYVSGQKHLGSLTMITTRGLGTGHEKLPRFNNPPELIQINIIPGQGENRN